MTYIGVRQRFVAVPLIGTIRREYLDATILRSESDLEKKLYEFMIYYNEGRVHYAHDDGTPQKLSCGLAINKIKIGNYGWKSYCNGRFQIPISA